MDRPCAGGGGGTTQQCTAAHQARVFQSACLIETPSSPACASSSRLNCLPSSRATAHSLFTLLCSRVRQRQLLPLLILQLPPSCPKCCARSSLALDPLALTATMRLTHVRQRQPLPLLVNKLLQVLRQVQTVLSKNAAQGCGGQLSRHAAVVQLLQMSGEW